MYYPLYYYLIVTVIVRSYIQYYGYRNLSYAALQHVWVNWHTPQSDYFFQTLRLLLSASTIRITTYLYRPMTFSDSLFLSFSLFLLSLSLLFSLSLSIFLLFSLTIFLKNFDEDVLGVAKDLVRGAVSLHREVMMNFRKTAQNFHYEVSDMLMPSPSLQLNLTLINFFLTVNYCVNLLSIFFEFLCVHQ